MIESVQITLGGIKDNSQSSKVPKQRLVHEEKSKGSKNFEQKKRKKQQQYDDAQNHMKKTKTKRKSPSPTLGGTIDNFGKNIQMTKVQDTSDP